jgi:hypothetical protein
MTNNLPNGDFIVLPLISSPKFDLIALFATFRYQAAAWPPARASAAPKNRSPFGRKLTAWAAPNALTNRTF